MGAPDHLARRICIGVALSLAVHAAVLNLRHTPPPPAAPQPLTVRLQRPQPPAAPVVQATPAATGQAAPRRSRSRVIALPKAVGAAPAFTVETPPEAPAAPAFDAESARRSARAMANDLSDPAKRGTALAQFPEKPLETETKIAKAIGKAVRPDCKDGVPGGLLAPIYLMMDKKNSGCKW